MTTRRDALSDTALHLEEATVLRLEPGDVIVYKAQRALTQDTQAWIQETLASTFPGHKVVILDDRGDLTVVRPDVDGEMRG
jgi:hypothetical protein